MTGFLIKRFVRDWQQVENRAVRARYANFACIVGIVCNILLFLLKLAIGLVSGSVAVIADAFNNLSDMGSSLVVLLGFKLAEKPADKEHPFGHGRMEYMSGFIVSILIVLVGFELLKSSVGKIFSPEPVTVSAAVIVGLCASVACKAWMFFFNRKLGKTVQSAALAATATDCLTDCVATTAVILSLLIGAITGIHPDAYVGLAVAVFILYSGLRTAKETMDPLLGMPPQAELVEELKGRLMSYEGFVGLHDLIVHNYGPGRVFASVHIEVPDTVDIVRCHEQIDRCEKEIGAAMNLLLVVHMDPIATHDQEVTRVRQMIAAAVKELDERLTIHDFRMVRGEARTNLIFDVVLTCGHSWDTKQLTEEIEQRAKRIDPAYACVITYDVDLS